MCVAPRFPNQNFCTVVQLSRARSTLLGGCTLLLVWGAAVAVALSLDDGRPLWRESVAFAAGTCLIGSLGGWCTTRCFVGSPSLAVAGAMAGLLLRIMIPLAALAWLQTRGTFLALAGAGGLLTALYLTLLATDILLHIMMPPAIAERFRTVEQNKPL